MVGFVVGEVVYCLVLVVVGVIGGVVIYLFCGVVVGVFL